MTTCNWVDAVDGPCQLVGIHLRRVHDGYGLLKQMLCEKHWEVVLDDEYSKSLLDFQRLIDKLLATPTLTQEKWVQRKRAFDDEMTNFQDALNRMAK